MADKIIPLDNNATPANSKAGGTIAGSYKGVIAPVAKEARENNPDSNAGYKNELKSKGITEPTSDPKGYNIKSIQQAYYDGTIDKSTRDYMMADAIAKFARNTGKDIGNIGAQFTGGAIDNNREEALWDTRNKELFGNKITAETAQQAGTQKELDYNKGKEELKAAQKANKLTDLKLVAPELMKNYSDEAKKTAKQLREKGDTQGAEMQEWLAGEYALLASASTSGVDMEEHIGNIIAHISTTFGDTDKAASLIVEVIKKLSGKSNKSNKSGKTGSSGNNNNDDDDSGGILSLIWENSIPGMTANLANKVKNFFFK